MARSENKTSCVNPMLADLQRTTVERAYARWAPVYDVVCGPIFLNARRAATGAAKQIGTRVLEIGVGTGLSFSDYNARYDVTGIDISEQMIARARSRHATGRYPWVTDLQVMDAEQLSFPNGWFDAVVAQFVITLVANPERVLDECARVLAPGGEIILVNHFYSEKGMAAKVEDALRPGPKHTAAWPLSSGEKSRPSRCSPWCGSGSNDRRLLAMTKILARAMIVRDLAANCRSECLRDVSRHCRHAAEAALATATVEPARAKGKRDFAIFFSHKEIFISLLS
jgi:phosphatidylethanolamine/phosphatidyl-N-methylethanolamine N-methyltransferase